MNIRQWRVVCTRLFSQVHKSLDIKDLRSFRFLTFLCSLSRVNRSTEGMNSIRVTCFACQLRELFSLFGIDCARLRKLIWPSSNARIVSSSSGVYVFFLLQTGLGERCFSFYAGLAVGAGFSLVQIFSDLAHDILVE